MQQLVNRAKQRDADAFAELYSKCYTKLFRTAYYMTGSRQDAEDVVMDTVADAYAGISKLRNDDAFEGWIFKILYNKARRKRGAVYYNATLELPETLTDGDATDIIGDRADLLKALATLTEEERTIVILAVCDGYTSAEISKIMAINANTIRSKQLRALAKLRAVME